MGSYATIDLMKAILPRPIHASYQRHRKQRTWQIILPMVLTGILFLAIVVLLVNVSLFQNAGDVARWAAISTIWIVIPIIIASLILLIVLSGIIYLIARLLAIAPTYTVQAQDFVYKVSGYVKRGTNVAVKPVIFLNGIGASIKALFGRK